MTRTFSVLVAAATILVPADRLPAADNEPATAVQPDVLEDSGEPVFGISDFQAAESAEGESVNEDSSDSRESSYFEFEEVPPSPRLALRSGWWGVDQDGSLSNVAEWDDMDDSSPFWDLDGLSSDGWRTFDFFATGTNSETTDAGLYFYGGPGLSVDADYDRFLHRFGHDPLGGPRIPDVDGVFPPEGGFYDPPLDNGDPGSVMHGDDLDVGEDHAIRVQEMDVDFEGRLTDNIRWRLNVWGLKKTGMRQANSTQHCWTGSRAQNPDAGNTCHVVSQGQHIDWLTMEVEPVIEARFGAVTLEYSRTMRSFQQNDELVTRDYSSVAPSYGFQAEGPYAVVPENYTTIDRMKLGALLTENTDLYVVGHLGNTHNKFRESDRRFYGVDARLTNTSIEGLRWTVYGETSGMDNSADTVSLNTRYPDGPWLEDDVPPTNYDPESLYLGLVDRVEWATGVKGRWRPFHDSLGLRRRLAVTGGYEYKELKRRNVTYDLTNLEPFTQPTTLTNMFFVGLKQDWSTALSSFVRYRMTHNNWPLVGVTHRQQLSLDAAINSNLPETEDRIEIGGNWSPTNNFMVNASFWIQNTSHHSDYVSFDEDSYPIVISSWYAPTERWSFTAGYATFSNWIDQDITLGREDGEWVSGPHGGQEFLAWTDSWSYTGRADVLNFGSSYAWSSRVTLSTGFEFVKSRNVIGDLPVNSYSLDEGPPGDAAAGSFDYPDLPGYSQVRVNTYRVMAGLDYALSRSFGVFGRYNYYDYDDRAMAFNAGTAHMFLAGVNGVY
ncbi:MAG: hypothetical protein ACQESR_03295 [Planctomycetota bacterium]